MKNKFFVESVRNWVFALRIFQTLQPRSELKYITSEIKPGIKLDVNTDWKFFHKTRIPPGNPLKSKLFQREKLE